MREVHEEYLRRKASKESVLSSNVTYLGERTRKTKKKQIRAVKDRAPFRFRVNIFSLIFILVFANAVYSGIRDAVEEVPQRLLPQVTTSERGNFALLEIISETTEQPRWDPCLPIEFVVNPSDEPAGGRDELENAMREVQAATGLKLVLVGETNERYSDKRDSYQPDRYPTSTSGWAPVLIDWQHKDDFQKSLGNSTDKEAIGFAGPTAATSGATDVGVNISGTVTLDADWARDQIYSQNEINVRAVIMHELGHLVGLDHVNDETQIMNPTQTATSWGTGDLQGLALQGSAICKKPHERPELRHFNYK